MRNWLIGFSLLVLAILWQVGQLTYHVIHQKNQWEQTGSELAKEYTAIQQITKISLFHGNRSYIVVEGKNPGGIEMIAWFREEGSFEGFEYTKDLIPLETVLEKAKKELPNADLVRVQPGIENRKPLWEVVMKDQEGKLGYYYYDMKTGQFLRSYRLQKVIG